MSVIDGQQIGFEEVVLEGVTHTSRANVIGPDQGWADHTLRVFRIGPGGHTPRHEHDWQHINYIIEGRGTLMIGDDTRPISRGDFAVVPSNTRHQFRNESDQDLVFICIVPQRGAY